MENQKNIVVITASEVKNLELAEHFRGGLEKCGAHVHIINLVELDLPLFNSRNDLKYKGELLLEKQLAHMNSAHGFVFIAPEYNGGTPPVFTNFLAWLSRSSKDWRNSLNSKPGALATYSAGGGFNVLLAMRTQLAFIGMNIIGRQILTHSAKSLDEKSLDAVCQELIRVSL